MITNADCTLYRRIRGISNEGDIWKRVYIPEVWWFENTQSAITTNGLKSADVLTVRIWDTSIQVKKGDYLVKGNCGVSMETVKDLSGHEHFCVTGVNYNIFGDNPHIKVVGV